MGPSNRAIINMYRNCSDTWKEEEILIAFLSGVNQVFLLYLFLTMSGSLIMEDRGSLNSPSPEDYNFELDSGLRRGAGHATSIICMAVLSVAAMMWIGCVRIRRSRRIVDLQISEYPYHGSRRH